MANLGRVFNEVPELYDRVRPRYPEELFADLASITGLGAGAAVLEVGAGTGQATRDLEALGFQVTALEPGAELAALARRNVDRAEVVTSPFEDWDDRGARFDLIVAASSWHWVEPEAGWRKAYELLRPGGWIAMVDNVVVRRPGEPEMYALTADLHERFSPGNPDWGHPPTEEEARAADRSLDGRFAPTIMRWFPLAQPLDGAGLADLLRTQSLVRRLTDEVREPLLEAIAARIGDNVVVRRYLTLLRLGQRPA